MSAPRWTRRTFQHRGSVCPRVGHLCAGDRGHLILRFRKTHSHDAPHLSDGWNHELTVILLMSTCSARPHANTCGREDRVTLTPPAPRNGPHPSRYPTPTSSG